MRYQNRAALASGLLVGGIAAAQSPPHYHATVLNIPGAVDPDNNFALNNNGVLVTSVLLDDQDYGVSLDTVTGESQVFGFPTGLILWVGGLNNSGVAVGICSPGAAFVYQNGTTSLMPLPPSIECGRALAINDAGIAVGSICQTQSLPAIWDTNTGSVTVLPAPGSIESELDAVNNQGASAGYAIVHGEMYAAVWTQAGMVLLPRFGGPSANAVAINDAGQVLFNANDAPGSTHAYIWANGVTTQVAANVPGGSRGVGLSQSGDIVGANANGPMLVRDGEVFDLNSLILDPPPGLSNLGPVAMNDAGAILEVGIVRETQVWYLVLLTPAHCGSADFNHDGDPGTDADIEAFFACLGGNCCAACDSADFNADGDLGTDADIEAFFRVLGGGSC